MKNNICIRSFICLLAVYVAPTPEYETAVREGAETKIVFRIVDDEGNPIKDARVGAGFDMGRLNGNPQKSGFTDVNGVCTLEEKSIGTVIFVVTKDGYYRTREKIKFSIPSESEKCLKDGKWQPYGAIRTVVLKPKKNPIPMSSYWYNKKLKTLTEPIVTPIGFDLQIGDLVKPHGKGVVSDFLFSNESEDGRTVVTMTFSNPQDGGYIKEKDLFSEYVSDYQAATNNVYQNKLVFEKKWKGLKTPLDTTLTYERYLVLRTRTKVNEKGELIEAYYSKIYGPVSFTDRYYPLFLDLHAFVNLTPNDTNLEFDPQKNLYKPPYRNVSNPYYILNESYP